jgi:hypothetical protein
MFKNKNGQNLNFERSPKHPFDYPENRANDAPFRLERKKRGPLIKKIIRGNKGPFKEILNLLQRVISLS